MILKNIHIQGFGTYHDFTISDLKPGINLVMGDNEAGKSTLLKFIHFTLFGYPRSVNDRMEPLNGGQHGGHIAAVNQQQQQIIFKRMAGANGGATALTIDNVEKTQATAWHQLLGNASGELFRNIYGFTLDELVNLASLDDSGIQDRIYSIGLGLNLSISEIENAIIAPAEAIYKKSGRNTEINKLKSLVEEKQHGLKALQMDINEYNQLRATLGNHQEESRNLNTLLQQIQTEHTKLKNYLTCYPHFIRLAEIENQLQGRQTADYPADGLELLESLVQKAQSQTQNIQILQQGSHDSQGIDQVQAELESIKLNQSILAEEESITNLNNEIALFRDKQNQVSSAEQRIEQLHQNIALDLQDINPGWTEAQLSSFSHKTQRIDKLNRLEKEIHESQQTTNDLQQDLNTSLSNNMLKISLNMFILMGLMGTLIFLYFSHYLPAGILLVIVLILGLYKSKVSKHSKVSRMQAALDTSWETLQKLQDEYSKYLGGLGLPADLSPQAARDTIHRIFELKATLNDCRERENEKQKLQTWLDQFQQRLAQVWQNSGQQTNLNPEAAVNELQRQLAAERNALGQQQQLQNQLASLQRQLSNRQQELQALNDELHHHLKVIAATDEMHYRQLFADNEMVKSLLQEKQQVRENIARVAGYQQEDALIAYLEQTEKETLEQNIADLQQQMQEKQESINSLNQETGRCEEKLKQLSDPDTINQAQNELQTAIAQLNQAYRDWLAGKVAEKVFSDVTGKYEQERQPEVIKNASTHFKRITNNAYEQVRVSLQDNRRMSVVDHRQVSKSLEQLSRGTREQLLISLRLGLIEAYELHNEPLPVIFDDVLVNFDHTRLNLALDVLETFAQDRQVLIFTCHHHLADLLADAVNRVELKPKENLALYQ